MNVVQGTCKQAVLGFFDDLGIPLAPQMQGWIIYCCDAGLPAPLILHEVNVQLAWIDICAALKQKFPGIADKILLELMKRFKSGELDAGAVYSEAEKLIKAGLHSGPAP